MKQYGSAEIRAIIVVHYENMPIQLHRKFYHQKIKIWDKKSDIFHISAQNIDCGYSLEPPRRGGSNEYPQSMFWAEIRKIMYTPVNPSFTIWKWGLRGSKLYRHVFVMRWFRISCCQFSGAKTQQISYLLCYSSYRGVGGQNHDKTTKFMQKHDNSMAPTRQIYLSCCL